MAIINKNNIIIISFMTAVVFVLACSSASAQSKVNSNQWVLYFGESQVGDRAWQAGIREKRNKTSLFTEGCSQNAVVFTDDNEQQYHEEGPEGDGKRTSWLRYGRDLKQIAIELKEGSGWDFEINKKTLNEAFHYESFFICSKINLPSAQCLEFSTNNMKHVIDGYCKKKRG